VGHRELSGHRLSDTDRTLALEHRGDRRIAAWPKVCVDLRAILSHAVARVEDVFDPERHARERSALRSCRIRRGADKFFVDNNEGSETFVDVTHKF
jgi:hypothetical protein